jgi:hypothetical protein
LWHKAEPRRDAFLILGQAFKRLGVLNSASAPPAAADVSICFHAAVRHHLAERAERGERVGCDAVETRERSGS